MTVSELIEKLKEANRDAEILIVHPDWDIKNITIKTDRVVLS